MRIALTAGFDRALHVILLAELLVRDGHQIAGLLVVNPFSVRRLRSYIRQRGKMAVFSAGKRLVGISDSTQRSCVEDFACDQSISHRSLKRWAHDRGVRRYSVSNLNASASLDAIVSLQTDAVIYGGGGILRRSFLKASNNRVLNAHSGPLPEIRGMNACEWSLLLGTPLAVTIHLIDRGIDTGPVIDRVPIESDAADGIDQLRDKCVLAGILGLRTAVKRIDDAVPTPHADAHRQCYVMAPAIRELLEYRLANQKRKRNRASQTVSQREEPTA